MNEKITLNITLPATRRSYDLKVPTAMTIRTAGRLIASILAKQEPERYTDKGDIALMDKATGKLLSPDITVNVTGLVNGSQLVLV